MEELDRRHPGYGFASHKGYGTAEHREALQRLGPTMSHRMSFPVIRELRGGYCTLFYELRTRLEQTRSRPALVELEARLRAAEETLEKHEFAKLRLLISRRWKLIES